jgi:hypothetical protein
VPLSFFSELIYYKKKTRAIERKVLRARGFLLYLSEMTELITYLFRGEPYLNHKVLQQSTNRALSSDIQSDFRFQISRPIVKTPPTQPTASTVKISDWTPFPLSRKHHSGYQHRHQRQAPKCDQTVPPSSYHDDRSSASSFSNCLILSSLLLLAPLRFVFRWSTSAVSSPIFVFCAAMVRFCCWSSDLISCR